MKTKMKKLAKAALSLLLMIVMLISAAAIIQQQTQTVNAAQNNSTPITAAHVSITAPVGGQTPDTSGGTTGSFSWETVTWNRANQAPPFTSTFVAGESYTASITLIANTGYTFTGLQDATINAQTLDTLIISPDGKEATIAYSFIAAANATGITTAAINVTAPVIGQMPNPIATAAITTATGTSTVNAPGSVTWEYESASPGTWLPVPSQFQSGTRYRATVTLSAPLGHTFAGIQPANVTINAVQVNTGTDTGIVDNKGSTLTIYREFTAFNTGGGVIQTAAVNVHAPVAHLPPNTVATAGAPNYTVSAVTWNPPHNSFQIGTQYTATVTLTATGGHTFTGQTTATMNGQTAAPSNITGTTLTLSGTFTAVAPGETLSTVAITVTAPVIGQMPDKQAYGSGNFSLGDVGWYREGQTTLHTGAFMSGEQYTAAVALTSNDGYKLSNTLTATINGNTADVQANNEITAALYFTFTAAVGTARTANVGMQTGALVAETPGIVNYTVVTANIANGTYNINVAGLPTGVTAPAQMTITNNTGTLTLTGGTTTAQSTTTTLTLTIDGVQSPNFTLAILAVGTIPVTSITVTGASGETLIVTAGGTLQMSASVAPTTATTQTVTWSLAGGSNIATISTTGLLTASGNGVVTVRATANDGTNVVGERQITISGQAGGGGTQTPGTIPGSGGTSSSPGAAVNIPVTVNADTGAVTISLTITTATTLRTNAINQANTQGIGAQPVVALNLSSITNAGAALLNADSIKIFSDANVAMTVALPAGELYLSPGALAALVSAAGANAAQVTLEASNIAKSDLQGMQAAQANGFAAVVSIEALVGSTKVNVPMTVHLPYTLRANETAAGIVAWRIEDNGELRKIDGMYSSASGRMSFTIDSQSYFAVGYDVVGQWRSPYTDVPTDSWFYEAVANATHYGLFGGMGDGLFSPQTSMTRAMFAMVLHNIENNPGSVRSAQFRDVPSWAWYYNAVTWSADNNIAGGIGDGLYAPDRAITRQEMAVMLYNYSQYKGYYMPSYRPVPNFSDYNRISNWALTASRSLFEAAVLSGSGNEFAPTATATRAQVAQMFTNFMRFVAT